LTNEQDRANLYKLAYSPSAGGLPDELKGTVDESLYSAGIQTAPKTLDQLRQGVTDAEANMDKTSQPNEALRVLQEAVRAKSGQATQGVGESDIFKKAGLEGANVLSQSIAAQGSKLKNDMATFQNTISKMSGNYQDMATAAYNRYNTAFKLWETEANRLERSETDLTNHAQAIEMLNIQNQNTKDLAKYNQSLEDGTLGQEYNINSLSGNSYNWESYNRPGGIEYIQDLQRNIDNVGKLENITDVADYIHNNYPNSLITADDIVNVSEETGVGWEEMLGLLAKESNGGTSNVAKKNNNFGGITWSQSYQENNQGVSKGTARPANEGGNYVKFDTVKDGLMAQAEQFTKRKISNTTNATEVGGTLGPAEELQITQMVTRLTKGKGDTAYKESVAENARELFITYGMNMDDIEDTLRLSGQSTEMSGIYRDAAEQTSMNLSGEKLTNFLDTIDRSLQDGNTDRANALIKKQARTSLGVEGAKQLSGKERTVQLLEEIRDKLKTLEDNGINTNIFSGTTERIIGKAGDVGEEGGEMRNIATTIATAIQNYRKAMSGVAFSVPESKEYQSMFPSISKTKAFNTANIDALTDVFGGDIDFTYEEQMGKDAYNTLFKDGAEVSSPDDGMTDDEAYQEYLKTQQ